MKAFICSVIVATLLLGGCAGQEAQLRTEENSVLEETITSPEVLTAEEVEVVNEKDKSAPTNESKEDSWLTYAERYDAEHRFVDLYILSKCWLIGSKNIVEVVSLGGIDDVTVVEHTAVERVEHLDIGDFTNISVFDKTGQSISVMVSPEDAEKLLGLIEKN